MRPFAKTAVLLSLLSFGACQTGPAVQISSGLRLAPAFTAAPPSQIAILPVEDGTSGAAFGDLTSRLRDSFQRELALRAYSPIAPNYVDQRLEAVGKVGAGSPVDPGFAAGLKGGFQEEALVGFRVLRWDDSRIVETRRAQFSIEVLMVGASSGETLWSGQIGGAVKAGGEGASPLTRARQIEAA
ncbi:MAG: hypothetical protein ACO3UM_13800, partial [Planctomycetota bacterium]